MATRIGIEVGLEGAEQSAQGLRTVGQAVTSMGAAATSASGKISSAIDQMKAIEAARISAEIDKASAAYQRAASSSSMMGDQLQAAAAKRQEHIAQLKGDLAKLSNGAEMSAKQTAYAFRQLPLQFQDAFVSIAGGMNPLMVAIQQVPQITGSFGGVRATIAALGAAISPTAAAAAALAGVFVVAGIAAHQGAAETRAFEAALISTNGRVGMTSDQLAGLAQRMDGLAGVTRGQAAEALAVMAAQSGISAGNIEQLTAVALRLQNAGGPAVAETAAQFAALARDPLAASVKLNDATGYLTESVYKQIRALEARGQREQAAKVAQDAYAAAAAEQAKAMEANMGTLERSWTSLKNKAREAWDAMLNIGREDTLDQQIAAATKRLDEARAMMAKGGRKGWFGETIDPGKEDVATAQAELDRLQAKKSADETAAQVKAAQAKAVKDMVDNDGAVGDRRRAIAAAQAGVELARAQAATDAAVRVEDGKLAKMEALRAAGLLSERQAAEQSLSIELAKIAAQRALIERQLAQEAARQIKADDIPAQKASSARKIELTSKIADLSTKGDQARAATDTKIAGVDLAQAREQAAAYAQVWQQAEGQIKQVADQIGQSLVASMADPTDRAQAQADMAAAGILRTAALMEQSLQNQIGMLRGQGTAVADAQANVLQGQLASLRAGADVAAGQASAKPALDGAASAEQRVQALQAEISAMELARTGNMSLAQAVEQVAIQRLQEARADAVKSGDPARVDAIDREIAARKKLGDTATVKDYLGADVGGQIAAGFDQASQSLSAFVTSFGALVKTQDDYDKARKAAGTDQEQLAAVEARNNRAQINAYGTMAGAAKGFFSEGSKGYKAMEAAEKTFRAVELVMSIKNAAEKMGLIGAVTAAKVAGDATQAASTQASATTQVAASMTEGTAAAAVGVANQAKGDPYTAPARMAIMAAAMAALGFATGSFGGGGGDSAPVTNTGTGTVLGDPTAKSESLSKAIDALADVDTITMRYSAQMAASLRNIESGIGGMGNLIARGGGVRASAAGISEGRSETPLGSALASLNMMTLGIGGAVGNLVNKVFGTKTSISQQGLTAAAQSLGSVMDAGAFDASYYTDIRKKRLGRGASYSTQLTDAGAEMERQLGLVFGGVADSMLSAGDALGLAREGVETKLRGYVIDIGRIDLKGLTGEQIGERLSAVISAESDRIARAALPGLEEWQRVGEGYYETAVRVAAGTEAASAQLRRLGIAQTALANVTNKQADDVGSEIVRRSIVAAEGQVVVSRALDTVSYYVSGIGDIISTLNGSTEDIVSTYRALLDVRVAMSAMGLSGAAVTRDLVAGAGGIEELNKGLSAYQDGFATQAEKLAVKTDTMRAAFARLGLDLPGTADAFRSLVRGIDTSSASGQELLGQVLGLSAGMRDLLDAVTSTTGGITDEIERIRALSAAGTAGQSLAQLQAQFAVRVAQAKAGDGTALESLPDASKALLDAAETMAGSSIELRRMRASTATALQGVVDVVGGAGAAIVPQAPVEAAPAVAPPAQAVTDPALQDVLAELQSLRELTQRQAEQAARRDEQLVELQQAVAAATAETARVLREITPSGGSIAVSLTDA